MALPGAGVASGASSCAAVLPPHQAVLAGPGDIVLSCCSPPAKVTLKLSIVGIALRRNGLGNGVGQRNVDEAEACNVLRVPYTRCGLGLMTRDLLSGIIAPAR